MQNFLVMVLALSTSETPSEAIAQLLEPPPVPVVPVWALESLDRFDEGEAAPTTVPARGFDAEAATRAVDDGLAKGDRRLGLDLPAAGTIASALASAVQSLVVEESSATYVAHVGSDGLIASVDVARFDGGDTEAWQGAANQVAKELGEWHFMLRERYRSGAVVTIEVERDVQSPARWLKKTERAPESTAEDEPEVRHYNLEPIFGPFPADMESLGMEPVAGNFSGAGIIFDVSDFGAGVQGFVYVRSVIVDAVVTRLLGPVR